MTRRMVGTMRFRDLLAVLLWSCATSGFCADWIEAGSTGNFVDRSSVRYFGNGIATAWTKYRVDNMLQQRANARLSTNGYEEYLYSIGLKKFDCINKMSGPLETLDYDVNGNVLESNKFNKDIQEQVYKAIAPESIGEKEALLVCKIAGRKQRQEKPSEPTREGINQKRSGIAPQLGYPILLAQSQS